MRSRYVGVRPAVQLDLVMECSSDSDGSDSDDSCPKDLSNWMQICIEVTMHLFVWPGAMIEDTHTLLNAFVFLYLYHRSITIISVFSLLTPMTQPFIVMRIASQSHGVKKNMWT